MMRRLFALTILLVLLATAGAGYYALRPLPLPATPFEFTLKQGSSLKGMARDMRQAGLLEHDWAFVWLARLLGKSAQLKAGKYALQRPVSSLELLEMLNRGQVVQGQVSVIEGWTFRQLRVALDANPDVAHDTQGLSD